MKKEDFENLNKDEIVDIFLQLTDRMNKRSNERQWEFDVNSISINSIDGSFSSDETIYQSALRTYYNIARNLVTFKNQQKTDLFEKIEYDFEDGILNIRIQPKTSLKYIDLNFTILPTGTKLTEE